MPATAPLTFAQGDDIYYDFVVVGADEVTPINLNGATIESQIRKSCNASSATVSFSVTYTDLENGKFKLSLNNTQTSAIPVKGCKQKYYYDVEMTQYNGDKIKLMTGTIVVQREITR